MYWDIGPAIGGSKPGRFMTGGLSPTLTAQMGGHGNNYVYLLEDRNDTGESPRNLSKGLLDKKMQPHDCNWGGGIKIQK